MPIPDLTPFGVLPVGRHDCTLEEIEAVYTATDHRRALWADLRLFLSWLDPQPKPSSILFDGSFTSDKAAPSDVDLVFDLEGCDNTTQVHWNRVFFTQRQSLKVAFRVDFWVYMPGAPRDLRAFFEYVKLEEAVVRGMAPEDLKGLLRVAL